MNPLDEQIVRNSIIAIVNIEHNVIGTGFFISPEGHALTCYHVVEDLDTISIIDYANRKHDAAINKNLSLSECDIAVIKIDVAPPGYLTPTLSYNIGDEVWTAGYHFFGQNIKQPVPTLGRIEGTTSVSFEKSQTYTLNNILRIGSATIEEGISGGPVLLLKEKKTIGIANAKFSPGGGFSMPFAEAILHSDSLKNFLLNLIELDKNDSQRQKYLLFDLLLKIQVRRALNRLIDNEQFLKGSIQPRNAATKNILQFLKSPYKIFPLLGMSGVGKTSLLASLAEEQLYNYPIIFLSAYQLSIADNGLKGDIEKELVYLLEEEKETRVTIDTLMDAFDTYPHPITVIIEGFNEISATPAKITRWIDRTADWIKACNIRLIISSRPEFWQQYETSFPKNLFYKEEPNEQYTATTLNDFTEEELAGAIQLYKLPSSFRGNTKLGHPLLLRMTWALQKQNKSANQPTSSHLLFRAFIKASVW